MEALEVSVLQPVSASIFAEMQTLMLVKNAIMAQIMEDLAIAVLLSVEIEAEAEVASEQILVIYRRYPEDQVRIYM
jgi:hypothetical protein